MGSRAEPALGSSIGLIDSAKGGSNYGEDVGTEPLPSSTTTSSTDRKLSLRHGEMLLHWQGCVLLNNSPLRCVFTTKLLGILSYCVEFSFRRSIKGFMRAV